MLVIDTPIVSEIMRPSPNRQVMNWLNQQSDWVVHITAVTEAEIRAGIACLSRGQRRRELELDATFVFGRLFPDRILPFDRNAAQVYASLVAHRRSIGRELPASDGQIAAIARSRGMRVATRNVKDFEHLGLEIVNPWPE